MKKIHYIRSIIFLLIFTIIFGSFQIITGFAGGAGDGKGILAYGLDVSYWQGNSVNWTKVKASGKTFAMIRAGSTLGKDDCFETNYKNAKAVGMNCGSYFYSYATTVDGAKEDAKMLLGWLNGKQFEYPIYYDLENKVQLAEGMTTKLRTDMCIAFMKTLSDAGWYVGTYANENWYKNYLDKATLGADNELWLASWTGSGNPSIDYSSQYGVWQYSSEGSVSGIGGNVDLDVAYKDYPTIIKNGGYNGYAAAITEVKQLWKITTSGGVNVRNGACTSCDLIGFLNDGAEITVTATAQGNGYTWGRISYSGKTGWCVLDFAKLIPVKLETISTTKCKIDSARGIIYGLNEGIGDLSKYVTASGLGTLKYTETEAGFGTGTKVQLIDTDGKTVLDTYYIVIMGDLTGDGIVDAYDLSVCNAVANAELSFTATSPYFYAMDLKKDSATDINDSVIMSLAVNQEYIIDQTNV